MIRCIPHYQHRFILLLCAFCRTMDCIYLLICPSCIWCMPVIRASWRPSSSATRMFVWHMVQANIKENTQAPHYCFLRAESSHKGADSIPMTWRHHTVLYDNKKSLNSYCKCQWTKHGSWYYMAWSGHWIVNELGNMPRHIHCKRVHTSLLVLIFTISLSAHRGQNKMVDVMQTTILDAFYSLNVFSFSFIVIV